MLPPNVLGAVCKEYKEYNYSWDKYDTPLWYIDTSLPPKEKFLNILSRLKNKWITDREYKYAQRVYHKMKNVVEYKNLKITYNWQTSNNSLKYKCMENLKLPLSFIMLPSSSWRAALKQQV